MTKIENWTRVEEEEHEKTPYIWEYDNSDRIMKETGDDVPVRIYLYKVERGVYNVFTQNDRYLPRGHKEELKVNEDATVKQYTKEEGRKAVVEYLKRHPMRMKMLGYDYLEKRLDKIGTTDPDKDIKYFLEGIMKDYGRGTDYEWEKLQGSGQIIIYDSNDQTVYDSENKKMTRHQALKFAQDILDEVGVWIVDHDLEEKYQRKTFDDMLEETLGV